MVIREYLQANGMANGQLSRFLSNHCSSAVASLTPASLLDEKNFKQFKKELAAYANGSNGPFGDDRLGLYCEAHDVMEAISDEYAGNGLKRRGYPLSDSFIGNDEGILMLLKAIHQEKTQEDLAEQFRCSRTTIQNKQTALADGIRIGDMAIKTQVEYGGTFKTSVHPILLPLNLSEVYALISQLKMDAAQLDEADPRSVILDDIANKVYFQLSEYGKVRIADRMSELNGAPLREVPPQFEDDNTRHAKWMMLEKLGARVCVTTTDKQVIEGVMVPFFKEYSKAASNGRREQILEIKLDDKSKVAVPWSDVVSIEQAKSSVDKSNL